MKWDDWKYVIAYVAPVAALIGLYVQGIWSWSGIYVGFVLIPILETIGRRPVDNFTPDQERSRSLDRLFDWLLYLNIPMLYGLVVYYLIVIRQGGIANYEVVGMTCSVGLMVGTSGINVAHELGHRTNKREQLLAKILLLPALYMHFFIEHNRGHHKHVATPDDPASARLNEPIYFFWIRSVLGSWWNAWKLENRRLKQRGKAVWSLHNEMLIFQLCQAGYLLIVGLALGWALLPYAVYVAVFGFLMLESVNYIEHYGLERRKNAHGRYEAVGPQHSWNSDHEVGRIFLYELTRHSDHHFKATRKYQVLRHFDESPQLPFGYPTSILMALVPPLWFWRMNREVVHWREDELERGVDSPRPNVK